MAIDHRGSEDEVGIASEDEERSTSVLPWMRLGEGGFQDGRANTSEFTHVATPENTAVENVLRARKDGGRT